MLFRSETFFQDLNASVAASIALLTKFSASVSPSEKDRGGESIDSDADLRESDGAVTNIRLAKQQQPYFNLILRSPDSVDGDFRAISIAGMQGSESC